MHVSLRVLVSPPRANTPPTMLCASVFPRFRTRRRTVADLFRDYETSVASVHADAILRRVFQLSWPRKYMIGRF